MCVLLRGAAGLLAGLLLVPVMAVQAQNPFEKKDEKKDADKKDLDKKDLDKKDAKEPVNNDKTAKAGQVTGKVMSVNESQKSLRIKVTFDVPKFNQGEAQQLQNHQRNLAQGQFELGQAQQQMARAQAGGGNPNQIRQQMNDAARRMQDAQRKIADAQRHIAQSQARVVTSEKKTQDFEFTAAEDLLVRQANPPVKYDGEGKLVKYTKKELDELRGDPKLPGFPADFGDLTQNMVVTVSLVQKKGAGGKQPPVPPRGKDVDPGAAIDLLEEFAPKMSQIVILGEARP